MNIMKLVENLVKDAQRLEQDSKKDPFKLLGKDCECCNNEREVSETKPYWDKDLGLQYEETGKKIPCPDCREDFYQDNHLEI